MNSNHSHMKTTQPTRAILPLLALLCALSTYGQMDPFVTTWVTTRAMESITIPTTGDGYNYSVTWEEGGTEETFTGDATHTYATAGMHTVSITGVFPRIYFNDFSNTSGTNATKILTIVKWGNIAWTSMEKAFAGCSNLTYTATDLPNLSGLTDMSFMFALASAFDGDIGDWDVSNVTNMFQMFRDAHAFNQDIGDWNVSNVNNMQSMFNNAHAFNQDINSWDVSMVTDMFGMFSGARAFNRDISRWNVSMVTNFTGFLERSELSSENYDALLIGWNKLTLKSGKAFHGGSSLYTSTGAAARDAIEAGDGWTFNDGGEVDMTVSFAENNAGTITDIDGATTATMYVLAASTTANRRDDDNALFRIGPAGVLSFMSTPDFEDPKDAGMNNIYAAEVTVDGTTKVTVSVSVTDVSGAAPVVATPISNLSLAKDFGTRVIDLSGTFTFDGMLTLSVSVSASSPGSPGAVTAAIAPGTTMLTLTEVGLGESVITVTAMGGGSTVTDEFTVTVSRPFVTTWETTTADEEITIPTTGDGYNYSVTWEEGGMPETGVMGSVSHTYATPGTHTVSITGVFPRIYFNSVVPSFGSNASKILTIKKWGNIAWTSMNKAFAGCLKLESAGTDLPDLSGVTDMGQMFSNAEVFNGDISGWDVSSVTNMERMFNNAGAFNGDLSNWDVSGVTNMEGMFANTRVFNGDLSNWDVSSVNNMASMFNDAKVFNGDISNWDVSSVTDMGQMFRGTSSIAFNGDISNWDVSMVSNMEQMFLFSTVFDGNLGDWDVSGVTNFINFLLLADLSPENYDALLNGWEKLDLTNGLTFDAGSSQYTSAGAAARQAIMDDDMWTINDGGEVDMTVSFAENGIDMVTDIDGATTATMYVLAAPTTDNKRDNDNLLFRIDNMGALSFMSTPDFEDPQDAGMNNIYAVEVTVTEGGTDTKVTVSVSVTNVNEFPPVVVTPGIPNQSLDTGFDTHVIELADTFTDGDGDDLMLTVSTSSPLVVTAAIAPGGTTLTLTEVGPGESVIIVTANDGSNTVSEEFTVKVNKPPTATGISDLSRMEGFGTEDIDLSATFTDPDMDALTFTVMSADEGVVTAAIATTTLTITEVGPGSSGITVTAKDGNGGMVTDMFTVTVEMVTGVAETGRSLRAYPNPGSESLTVEMEGTWSLVRIYDFTGRHLHVPVREQGPKKVVLDISGLPGGTYLVKVSGGGGSTVRRLIVR